MAHPELDASCRSSTVSMFGAENMLRTKAIAMNLYTSMNMLSGIVEPIGPGAKFSLLNDRKKIGEEDVSVENHGEAAKAVLARLNSGLAASSGILSARAIHLIGHRVVHGDDRYVEAAVV